MNGKRENHDMHRAYNQFAPIYDLFFGPVLTQGRRRAVESLSLSEGARILEVGVGTGLSLSSYPAHVSVTGIDLSTNMLKKAQARVARRNLTQVWELRAMDACDMSFADHTFDAVLAMYLVSVVDDPVLLVSEMKRVCKPGGMLVIVNHFRTTSRLIRLAETVLAPMHRMVRFRADLDRTEFVTRAGLRVERSFSANIMGYSTVLCCRNV